MTIREATFEDEPHAAEVDRLATMSLREVYRPTEAAVRQREARAPHLQRVVAAIEGRVVGVVQYHVAGSTLYLIGLGVHPSHRRCGAARALIEFLEVTARQHGCAALELQTVRETGNVAILERLGFRVESERSTDRFISDRFALLSEVTMSKFTG